MASISVQLQLPDRSADTLPTDRAALEHPPSPRRSIRGAFDEPRGGDAERAADRPKRRSWWAVAAVCPRPPLQPPHAMRPLDARTRLAAAQIASARRSAARSTRRVTEMRIEPRIAPGGGRGGQQRQSARGLWRLRASAAGGAAGERAVGACGAPGGRRTTLRGATETPRAVDVNSHREPPRRLS